MSVWKILSCASLQDGLVFSCSERVWDFFYAYWKYQTSLHFHLHLPWRRRYCLFSKTVTYGFSPFTNGDLLCKMSLEVVISVHIQPVAKVVFAIIPIFKTTSLHQMSSAGDVRSVWGNGSECKKSKGNWSSPGKALWSCQMNLVLKVLVLCS